MSYQKESPQLSPFKSKYQSMITPFSQNNQSNMFSSRITQRRKPIFQQSINRSSISNQKSLRKKIFASHQKSTQKQKFINTSAQQHFSRIYQTPQISKTLQGDQKSYDDDSYPKNKEYYINGKKKNKRQQNQQHYFINKKAQNCNMNTIDRIYQKRPQYSDSESRSSGIQQQKYDSLNDIKKQLFHTNTPIKKIVEYEQQCQAQLQKNIFSQKTVIKRYDNSSSNNNYLKDNQDGSINDSARFAKDKAITGEKYVKKEGKRVNSRKDIAKSLRELYNRMAEKEGVCRRVDQNSLGLKKQNQILLQENRLLKQRLGSFMLVDNMKKNLNFNSQSSNNQIQKPNYLYSSLQKSSSQRQTKKLQNQNLNYRIKIQKSRNILQNLIQIGLIEQSNNKQEQTTNKNSILNIKSTLEQVIKHLTIFQYE